VAAKQFNVRDYGAKADGESDNSPAFNRAVESAIQSGNGTVVFVPAGR
jgi:polygalacturonase